MAAIQQYLRKRQRRKDADSLHQRHAKLHALHAWRTIAVLGSQLREMMARHGQHRLRLALQVGRYNHHVAVTVALASGSMDGAAQTLCMAACRSAMGQPVRIQWLLTAV